MSVARLRLEFAKPALAAFKSLYGNDPYAFLCESLGTAGRNRFSFFGGRPTLIHRSRPSEITIEHLATGETLADPRDLLDSIRALLASDPETAGRAELALPYRVDAYWCERLP